jgi:hypothetical protein
MIIYTTLWAPKPNRASGTIHCRASRESRSLWPFIVLVEKSISRIIPWLRDSLDKFLTSLRLCGGKNLSQAYYVCRPVPKERWEVFF